MKKSPFIILFLIALVFSGCGKETNSENVERKLSGKKWMSIHRVSSNGDITDTPAYNITSYYENGFKLKTSGAYIPKYNGKTNYKREGSWSVDNEGKYLIIEDGHGNIHQFEILKLTGTRLELAFPNHTLVFAPR